MIARAITQILTHRRTRHGSWRDGEGGALDALTLLESEVEGGADGEAPSKSSKATQNRLGATRSCAAVFIDGRQQLRRRIAGGGSLRWRPRIARRQHAPKPRASNGHVMVKRRKRPRAHRKGRPPEQRSNGDAMAKSSHAK